MAVILKVTAVYVDEIFLNQYLHVALVVWDYGQMQSLKKKSKPNEKLQPVRMQGPCQWRGINTPLSKAYVGSDFLWRWQVVLFWKEMYMTHILKSSSTSVGKPECWSIKPESTLKQKCGLPFLEGSVRGEVGPSLPRAAASSAQGRCLWLRTRWDTEHRWWGANPGESAHWVCGESASVSSWVVPGRIQRVDLLVSTGRTCYLGTCHLLVWIQFQLAMSGVAPSAVLCFFVVPFYWLQAWPALTVFMVIVCVSPLEAKP